MPAWFYLIQGAKGTSVIESADPPPNYLVKFSYPGSGSGGADESLEQAVREDLARGPGSLLALWVDLAWRLGEEGASFEEASKELPELLVVAIESAMLEADTERHLVLTGLA